MGEQARGFSYSGNQGKRDRQAGVHELPDVPLMLEPRPTSASEKFRYGGSNQALGRNKLGAQGVANERSLTQFMKQEPINRLRGSRQLGDV